MQNSPATPATTTQFDAVAAAIKDRRTIKQFLPQPVPRELLAQLIELAVWAPNHHLTEPWRFYVLDGASRGKLAEIAHGVIHAKVTRAGATPEVAASKAASGAAEWAAIPALVFVTMVPDADPMRHLENYGAVSCAVQNLMLGAHAAGLATFWGTGDVAFAPEVKTLVGASQDEEVVGLIRIGYPLPEAVKPSRRTVSTQLTRWLDPAE
jgi:nitroreductase